MARRLLYAACLAGVVAASQGYCASVAITNPDFAANNNGWTVAAIVSAGTEVGNQPWTALGMVSAAPSGPDNNQAWSNSGDFYQVLAETLQANTEYTLSVDVGLRPGHGQQPVRLRLGWGSTVGQNYVGLAGGSWASPPNSQWRVWTTTFVTGPNPAGLGQALRIELNNAGSTQPQFDNVSLTTASRSSDDIPIFVVMDDFYAYSGWVQNGPGNFWIETKSVATNYDLGRNCTICRSSSGTAPYISQTFPETAQAGATYHLSFRLQRNNIVDQGVIYEIWAGTEQLGGVTIPAGGNVMPTTWTTYTLNTDAVAAGSPAIGQALQIRLGMPTGTGTDGGCQNNYDYVTFFETVPGLPVGTVFVIR